MYGNFFENSWQATLSFGQRGRGIVISKIQGSTRFFPPVTQNFFMDSTKGGIDFKDFALISGSPYSNIGTDGKDLGANVDQIYDAIYLSSNDDCIYTSILESNDSPKPIYIYPNSATNNLMININGSFYNQNTVVKIYSKIGQLVYSPLITGVSSNVEYSKLTNGM